LDKYFPLLLFANTNHTLLQLKENVYVKLHLSREATKELARAYDIDIQNTGHHYISVSAINLKISQTPLTLNQDIFTRKG
jgi:hypothetical protein